MTIMSSFQYKIPLILMEGNIMTFESNVLETYLHCLTSESAVMPFNQTLRKFVVQEFS